MKTRFGRQQTKTNLGAAHTLCLELLDSVQYIFFTNINHKGLQSTANEYAKEQQKWKVDILNSASRIFTYYDQHRSILLAEFNMSIFLLFFTWNGIN